MACLEALLAPVGDDAQLSEAMALIARELGGIFSWLDSRNASIALNTGPRSLAVQLLLEIRPRGELGVLLSSREGMGNGAPLRTAKLERLLAGLQTAVPATAVRFRCDRDCPVRHAGVA